MRGCSSINYRNTRTRWRFIHAWRGSIRSRKSVRGGAVSACGVSAAWMPRPSPHGRVHGVPALRHRPAKPRNASFCFCRCFGLKPLQVQGAALPKNTHKKTAGRGLLFRCNGAPGEIRTPDRLVRSQVLYPTELRARGTQSTYCLILLHFQRRMLKTCRVVRPERFELPTAWFVARYSIQLSYGRPATGAELCGCRRVPSTVL